MYKDVDNGTQAPFLASLMVTCICYLFYLLVYVTGQPTQILYLLKKIVKIVNVEYWLRYARFGWCLGLQHRLQLQFIGLRVLGVQRGGGDGHGHGA